MAKEAQVSFVVVAKDAATRAIGNVNRALGGLKNGAAVVGKAFVAMGAAAVAGITALAGGIAYAIKMAAEEEIGIKRLSAAIKANVKGRVDMAKVEDRIAKVQARLAYSDGELRDSLSVLIPLTGGVGKAFKAQAVAADLARAKNISLEDASKQIGLALNGNTRVLKQLGIELPKTASKAEILAAVQKKVAGQAEAYANSTQGQFDTLRNSIDDVIETLGAEFDDAARGILKWANEELVPALQKAIPKIAAFVKKIQEIGGNIAKWAVPKIKDLVSWIGTNLIPKIKELAGFIQREVLPRLASFADFLYKNREAILIVAGAIAGILLALQTYRTVMAAVQIITSVVTAAQWLLNAALTANPIGLIVLAIAALVGALAAAYIANEDFRKVVDGVFKSIGEVIGVVVEFVATLWGDGKGPLAIALGFIIGLFERMASVIGFVFDLVKKVIGVIGDLINIIADSPVGDFIGGIADGIGGLFGGERAKGGPVSAGKTYLVGEQGPEFFRPGVMGSIIPNGAIQASPVQMRNNTVVNTFVTLDGREIANNVNSRLGRLTLANTGSRSF